MISPELLRRHTFFGGFTDKELKGLAMAAQEKSVAEGEALFAEGDTAEAIYFLADGEMEILIHADEEGRESIPLSTLPAGELIGWSALIEPRIFTASARATRACRVVVFPASELEKLSADLHFYNLLLKKVAQVISRRLKDARIQLLSLSAHPV